MADMSEMTMSFPGGKKVIAHLGGHEILTDQPVSVGGEDAAPSPYSLFLASIGACAGFFVLSFCQKRDLPLEGVKVRAIPRAKDNTLGAVDIEVEVPPDFPAKYRDPLVRAVEGCSVKRAIQAMPVFNVRVSGGAPAPARAPAHELA